MTLFICFVQSFPPSSHYLSFLESRVCAPGSRQRNRMFLWHSHSEAPGLHWEQQSHRGGGGGEEKEGRGAFSPSLAALFQQVERFWGTAEWKKRASVSPSCAGAGIQPRRQPWWLWSITSVFSVTELEVRGAIARSPEGGLESERRKEGGRADGLPRHASTHAGRLPGSSLSHFMSTQLAQSVIQTLHRAVNVPCKCSRPGLSLVQLVSPTHAVISRRVGWTGGARGQSQLWLVLLGCGADEGSLSWLSGDDFYICRDACKHFFPVDFPGQIPHCPPVFTFYIYSSLTALGKLDMEVGQWP